MDNKEYAMNHEKRGLALVINNKHFPGNEIRHGSEKDVERIVKALESLEFEVKIYHDCTAFKMMVLINLYGSMNHENNDCSVCVLMSHGSDNTIQAVDGKLVKIDELTESFKVNPSLIGKPKIFFIQACRDAVEIDSRTTASQTDSCAQADTRLGSRSNQLKEADVLIQYSTVLGYVSYRDPDSGSWFIQSLASTLLEKGQTESLHHLTQEVQRKVIAYCKDSKIDANEWQCANVNHTLPKDVYFRPKMKLSNNYPLPATSITAKNISNMNKNVLYFPNGERYEGECCSNGKKHGKGTYFFSDGNKYTGDWFNDDRTGNGVFYFASGHRYEGDFLEGKFHGKGTYFFKNGDKYTGDWYNDRKSGKGIYYTIGGPFDGDRYEGDFLEDKFHGKGTFYYYYEGKKYTGDWNKGQKSGKGVYYFANGERCEADFLEGKIYGKVTYFYSNGSKYIGDWNNDNLNGKGVLYYANGERYEGDFQDGKRHGKGIYFYSSGKTYTGNWYNNYRTG